MIPVLLLPVIIQNLRVMVKIFFVSVNAIIILVYVNVIIIIIELSDAKVKTFFETHKRNSKKCLTSSVFS